jgi:ABC-type polysaccharide/polyol phosphate transport system ATPase subunit
MNKRDVIVMKDVYLSYRTLLNHERTLKGFAISLAKGNRQSYSKESAQLKGVTLSIRHGEQVGVIGRNGSGKSTLLKLIAGVLRPDYGQIEIDGAITPLIDIGTGMNPELTCRENIYLSGAYLGFSRKDMDQYFKSIIEWAEIESVLDNPFHTLSTGMQGRLAFAVSTCQKPEIILIDEIMSVGDIAFQEKSAKRMEELKSGGSAVIIVSHDLAYLSSSVSRVIWIKDGHVEMDGSPDNVITAYQESF